MFIRITLHAHFEFCWGIIGILRFTYFIHIKHYFKNKKCLVIFFARIKNPQTKSGSGVV